jgi:[ribosomal protein S5]-alanine N-acetyltransferase
MTSIELLELTPSDLERLAAGEKQVGRYLVADGALPPDFILRAALDAAQDRAALRWLAPRLFVSPEEDLVVGSGGFKGPPADRTVEIGYGVAPSARGRGVATLAVRQLVDEAFETPGVRRVYAETAVDNPASRRVVEKVGFTHTGQRDTAEDGLVDRWTITRRDA